MKKTGLVLALVLILVGLLITSVSAIDMNLINSVRQNELNAAENLPAGNAVNSTSLNALGNETATLPTDNTAIPTSNTPTTNSANISSVTDQTSDGLGIGDILNILLIVVGVLIILLGIAIIIRMKR